MTALANNQTSKRRLLLASDRSDQSNELASILRAVGEVDTVLTSDIPERPAHDLSGIVVDINLRSPEAVQLVRTKLQGDAYREMPRLFVLADALHHASMQAWALGATDTISRPFDARGLLQRIRAAFPDDSGYDETDRGKALNRGVEAAHAVMVKMFERMRAGEPLKFEDIVAAENKILKAIKHNSLREWLTTVGCHHQETYRHCLFVTGFPVALFDKPGALTVEEMAEMREHPRRGYEALSAQGGFPPEMLDVILHHHEFLDGTGYPNGLSGNQISDIVRVTTIVDVYAALVEKRAYRLQFTHAKAFSMMEEMGGKLDQQLLQAFRPVAFGHY